MTSDSPAQHLWTIGHSTRSFDDFVALLERERIETLVDVRRFPASRRHPQFESGALREALQARGVAYEHVVALGGRRRSVPGSANVTWRNDGFRGYADYMATADFQGALDRLLQGAAGSRTTVMCAEALPWRCHRTLIADAVLARGFDVWHILDAKTSPHRLTTFARIEDGRPRYDGGQSDLFALASG